LRIEIEKTFTVQGKGKVNFSTEYGKATAYWNGELPEEGKSYIVEIEIEEVCFLGKNLEIHEEHKFSIEMDNETIYLIGYLESSEEDGYAVLRLGDSIVPLEVKNSITPGSFVKIVSNKITLYDMKY